MLLQTVIVSVLFIGGLFHLWWSIYSPEVGVFGVLGLGSWVLDLGPQVLGPIFEVPGPLSQVSGSMAEVPGPGSWTLSRPNAPIDPFRRPSLHPDPYHLVTGSSAMVSSDSPTCSNLGKSIMLQGGNAADAAVTVSLCLGSINLFSSGIGGGAYIVLVRPQDGNSPNAFTIDAREMAPAAAHPDMFRDAPELLRVGGLSSAIPGEIKGLYHLFSRHGSGNLTWAQVIRPVIDLNRSGFEVTPVVAKAVQSLHQLMLPQVPAAMAHQWDFIYREDAQLVQPGDIMRRPNLARTLELVALNGSSDVFYDPQGPIVGPLVAADNRFGGKLSASDFSRYYVEEDQALMWRARNGYTLCTSKGVSSGPALVGGLNLYDYLSGDGGSAGGAASGAEDASGAGGAAPAPHLLIESMKWMASIRSRLGHSGRGHRPEPGSNHDPAHYANHLWPPALVAAGNYSPNTTFPWHHYDPLYNVPPTPGTSHFSIIDPHDHAVAVTTTINLLFGSLVYDPVTGIVLNNEMDDFSTASFNNSFDLPPSPYNEIRPYARPVSSMAPSVVLDAAHAPFLVVGAAGGSRITTCILQALVRLLYMKETVLNTVAFPRVHHQLIPTEVSLEDYAMTGQEWGDSLAVLQEMGHHFEEKGAQSTMNVIRVVEKEGKRIVEGVSDFWRKAGRSLGF